MSIKPMRCAMAAGFMLVFWALATAPVVAADRGGDCNDLNPNIHPGQAEVVGNRYDDDCDGLADEDPANNPSSDQGDVDGDLQAMAEGDCDDTNPSTRAGTAEIAGNLIDDDCDGLADEDANNLPSLDDSDTDGDGFAVLDRVFRSGFEQSVF